MKCLCADSVLIILLGSVMAGIFSIAIIGCTITTRQGSGEGGEAGVMMKTEEEEEGPQQFQCIAGLLTVISILCCRMYESCVELEEMHEKLEAAEQKSLPGKQNDEDDEDPAVGSASSPTSSSNPPTIRTSTVPKRTGKKSTKKYQKKNIGKDKPLGVSVHYLRTTFKDDVAAYVKQQKEAHDKKPFLQKLFSKKSSIQTKDINDINIYDIVEGVIKAKGKNVTSPRDGKQGAAFVDCLEGEDNVGVASIMLSYAWGNTVDDIVDVLYRACMEKIKTDPKRTYVWICCLCNNQHRFDEKKTFDQLQAIFKAQVLGIGVVVALMAPHDNPIYVTRAWCDFELNMAKLNEDKVTLLIMIPTREENRLIQDAIRMDNGSDLLFAALRGIKIEDADASVEEDRINILRMVDESGGPERLNHVINDVLREWQMDIVKDAIVRLESESESEDVGSDVSLAKCFFNVGYIFMDRGHYELALEYYFKCLGIREKVLGKKHKSTATTYNNIGGVYDKQGKYADALEYYEKSLAIEEKVLGKKHKSTAATYNNIGAVYDNQGKYADALEYYEKCLDIQEKVLGKKHKSTAATYNNIGAVYKNQGKYADALEYHEKCLGIQEKVLGKKHESTAATYNNIGAVYKNQGKYADALEYYEKCLVIFEKVLGEEHESTATIYNNIGAVYKNQGKYADALEYYEKCLDIREKVLGEEHESTANSYYNIAGSYESQGDLQKALEYYEKCLSTEEIIYGKNHWRSQDTKSKIDELMIKIKSN